MKKSIKRRLLTNFVLIIISMVVILELLFINTVKGNYYKNLEQNMLNQIKISSDLYLKYFSDSSLYENVLNNVDTYWKQTTAQVQIIDLNGRVIMDSIGSSPKNIRDYSDVALALKGETGTLIGKSDNYSEEVMSVSYPLNSSHEQVGVIRFVTSLKEINNDIRNITFIFISIGGLAILLGIAVIFILTKTITGPLNEVTKVAAIMASGNFKVKSKKFYEDEIGKLSDTLNYLSEEILTKEELKNDFISSVSHELRTPLTSIKGWAITLKEFNNDKDMLIDGLDIIEKESDRLTGMVEELLDFSKFVSGKITLHNRKVNIENLIEHIKKQYIPRANRENIKFTVEYNDIPNIVCDDNRLKQVFINLLDNAFKFTPNGGEVKFLANIENNNIIFKVLDTGCGISPEDLPKVKEKFFKGKNSNSKNGIGLSICDEIISMMNGSFIIESKLSEGTTVIVSIPITEER
ncbi:sensor histidine kinase [Clostridium cylindrosporum]|uniref:histidine kinase n=1 Tax=Clostridium cylindrosporum DSM 605 TaxID=1121307 RepID=A0A0J8D9Z5_CLOCY|nr:HAMP domain-containing sensor histidine kinase [Clostridium cylindrosporum]KMT21134.1 alkaline phosphatase synthesis sensor protein PhoR [Clostridium cylindrosporum DSM 605]